MTAVDAGSWLTIASKMGNLGRVEAIRIDGWREKLLESFGYEDREMIHVKRKGLISMLFGHADKAPKLTGVRCHSITLHGRCIYGVTGDENKRLAHGRRVARLISATDVSLLLHLYPLSRVVVRKPEVQRRPRPYRQFVRERTRFCDWEIGVIDNHSSYVSASPLALYMLTGQISIVPRLTDCRNIHPPTACDLTLCYEII